jgi:hypothetical protein
MEIIYDWLLHNMGNEANCFTILNVQRQLNDDKIALLDVMARTKDFKMVNVLIESDEQPTLSDGESKVFTNRTIQNKYAFSNEQAVIAYLSDGKITDSETQSATAIQVSVLVPANDPDDGLVFPVA